MVSKVNTNTVGRSLTALGSSVFMGGVALLMHAAIMEVNNGGRTHQSTNIAIGSAVAIFLGIGIAITGAIILDKNEASQEEAKQFKKDEEIQNSFRKVASVASKDSKKRS